MNQRLLLQCEYLTAENRILRSQLPARLRLSDAQRSTLGEIGQRLGRKYLAEVACVAKPATILAWYRRLDCAEVRRVQATVVSRAAPVSRQNPVGAYRNIINGSVAACRKLNGSLPHSSGLEARYCRTKGRWNRRTASICGGLTQCSDVRARPEYRAFRLCGLTVADSTKSLDQRLEQSGRLEPEQFSLKEANQRLAKLLESRRFA